MNKSDLQITVSKIAFVKFSQCCKTRKKAEYKFKFKKI